MNTNNSLWPPPYTLKRHPRARQVRLRASVHRGLELIVPSRFNVKTIPRLLDLNRAWIEKHLADIELNRLKTEEASLPTHIEFQALSCCWKVSYLAADRRLQLVAHPLLQEIVIIGKIQDKQRCKKLLLAWIKEQAKAHLLEHLQIISSKTGLFYEKAIIRGQTSRWGSCTVKKSISLNYKLLFFPPALMTHVLIHELCHTVYLNHSEKFWQLVARFDPLWRQHRRAIRKAAPFIPQWVL